MTTQAERTRRPGRWRGGGILEVVRLTLRAADRSRRRNALAASDLGRDLRTLHREVLRDDPVTYRHALLMALARRTTNMRSRRRGRH
jgi:hypothetical protein